MSAWANTDSIYDKPHIPVERQVREYVYLTTANLTLSGSRTIQFTGTGAADVANQGVTANMYVVVANSGVSGEAGFFASNVVVSSVSGNIIVLSAVTTGNIAAGATVEIDKGIVYGAGPANTYNQDTILVTPSRLANSTVNVAAVGPGWSYVQKTTNNDGAVRYRKELLVALANPVASNTNSGNTSFAQVYTGV
ncbi:MAG: hypothetical protein EB127_31495 [Alphaproteobacteria bacterium]|nr:hypothetical protein [Alphaproteobacteria bacterium]